MSLAARAAITATADRPIGELGLPFGAGVVLKRLGYFRLRDLTLVTARELLAVPGVGPVALALLEDAMSGGGLAFAAGPKKVASRSAGAPSPVKARSESQELVRTRWIGSAPGSWKGRAKKIKARTPAKSQA